MALLIECPKCRKRLAASVKECRSKTGKGCGAKIPHGNRVYWVQYRDPEGRVRQKKIGPSKKAAENYERKKLTEITEGKYIDKAEEKPKVFIKDFIEEIYRPWCKANNKGYRTKGRYLNKIVDMWGDYHLDELTDEEIERYRWQMQKEKKHVTFNRILSTISHTYTKAIEFKKIDARPFKTAGKRFKEKGRLRYLTPNEANRLVDSCAKHLKPIVITALHTGMRKTETLTLKLGEHVNLKRRIINLKETKNEEARHIPINETLHGVLCKVAKDKKSGDYLFCMDDGTAYKHIRKSFYTALSNAKIKDFTFHDLRHTFASNLVMDGVDLFVVKELLGHKSIEMTMKYAHLSPDHQSMAVNRLDRIFAKNDADSQQKTGSHIAVISTQKQ